MSTAQSTSTEWTVADLLARFGPVLHTRIRQHPAPGTATEQDVLDIYDREKRLYELIDGVLVEKTVGLQESFLALSLGSHLRDYAKQQGLGFVLGAEGMARLAPGRFRIPDISFIPWARFHSRLVPRTSMLDFAPELAVEVLSPNNTQEEMDQKLRDYFQTGVRLVWYVDAARRQVKVFTAVDQSRILREGDILPGDPVLPGFTLSLKDLFAELES